MSNTLRSEKRLKVFAVATLPPTPFANPIIQRCIVAASSQKEAAHLFKCSLQYLRGCGSETGNKHELAAALREPGKVLASAYIERESPDV